MLLARPREVVGEVQRLDLGYYICIVEDVEDEAARDVLVHRGIGLAVDQAVVVDKVARDPELQPVHGQRPEPVGLVRIGGAQD
jgi:hypothetical protein